MTAGAPEEILRQAGQVVALTERELDRPERAFMQ